MPQENRMKTQRFAQVSSPIESSKRGSVQMGVKRLNVRPLAIVFLFALLPQWSSATLAQTVTGTIVGTATDQTGAVLPNAWVTIASIDTGLTRAVGTSRKRR